MTSVTFPTLLGGDGSTVTDDSNASTGLGNGGHRYRFLPSLVNLVAMCQTAVNAANTAVTSPASLSATSTTSLTIGTGSKSLTLAQTGKGFNVNSYVTIASTANPANFMFGQITAFTAATGAMTVNVLSVGGSGTLASWSINNSQPNFSLYNPSNGSLSFYFDGNNIALGGTTYPWAAGIKALDFGYYGIIANAATGSFYFGQNTYTNGVNWIAKTTGAGALYAQASGYHYWYSMASVAAGASQSLLQTMGLDASGNLTIPGTFTAGALGNGMVKPQNLVNSGAELGMRNRIINGKMAIWQRGTSSGFSGYVADRWYSYAASGFPNTAQSTDVPSGSGLAYSLSITGTGAGLRQPIESANTVDLVGNSVTVSFWMKQTVGAGAGSMVVWLDYANAKDNFGAMTTISSVAITPTATWAKYTATFNSLPAGAANGLMLFFEPANSLVTDTFFITGVQLELGQTATPFEFRPYSVELAMCQRYYQTGYQIVDSYTAAGGAVSATLPFPVTPRATPTITPTAAGTNTNHGAISASTVAANSFPYAALIWANATATGAVRIESSFTISAEL